MDLEQKELLLARLHEDIQLCKDYFATIVSELKEHDITNYPIFVASRTPVELGKMILNKTEIDIDWSFYASHLEEFAVKEIVHEDKLADFQKLYKSHLDDFCFFVVLDDEFNFIFVPRKTIS